MSASPSTPFPSSPSLGSRRDAPLPLNLSNSSPKSNSSPLPLVLTNSGGNTESHLHLQHILRQTPSKLRDERTWSMSSIPIFLDSPGTEGLEDIIGELGGGTDAPSGIPVFNHPLDVDLADSDGCIPSPRRNLLALNGLAGPLTPAYGRVPLPCRESIASSSGFSSATSPTSTPPTNELSLDLGLLAPPARRGSSDSRASSLIGGGGDDDDKSLFSLSEYYARDDNRGEDGEENREEDAKVLSDRWHRNLDSPISPVEPNPFYSASCGPSPLSSACPLPVPEYVFPRPAGSPRPETQCFADRPLKDFSFPPPTSSSLSSTSLQPSASTGTIFQAEASPHSASSQLPLLSPRFPSNSPHLSAPASSNASTPTRSTHDFRSSTASAAALLGLEDDCLPSPSPTRSKSSKAGPPVSFATPTVNRSVSEQIPTGRTHRSSSSYSGPRSRNSMYTQLGKELSIELWIDRRPSPSHSLSLMPLSQLLTHSHSPASAISRGRVPSHSSPSHLCPIQSVHPARVDRGYSSAAHAKVGKRSRSSVFHRVASFLPFANQAGL
jgi:hypothetical protein